MDWRLPAKSTWCRRCDQLHYRGGRDGRAVVDALRDSASAVAQVCCGLGVLDTLGDSCHIQSMRQINDSTHDGVGARVCQYIADRVLIDFDFIDGQLA